MLTGESIIFNSTVDSQSGVNASLTLSAGSGSVAFLGNLGAIQPLGALTVTQADSGVAFYGSSPNQTLTVDTAGNNIAIAAPVTLYCSVVFN